MAYISVGDNRCPSCGEMVPEDSLECPYCHYAFPDQFSEAELGKPSAAGSRASLFFVLILAIGGAAILLVAAFFLRPAAPTGSARGNGGACTRAMDSARAQGLVRGQAGHVIQVDDAAWAATPADRRRSFVASALCASLDGNAPGDGDYVEVDSAGNGARLARGDAAGVVLQ